MPVDNVNSVFPREKTLAAILGQTIAALELVQDWLDGKPAPDIVPGVKASSPLGPIEETLALAWARSRFGYRLHPAIDAGKAALEEDEEPAPEKKPAPLKHGVRKAKTFVQHIRRMH